MFNNHKIALFLALVSLAASVGLRAHAVELYRPTYDSKDLKRPKNLSRLNLGATMEMSFKNGKEDAVPSEFAAGLLTEDFSLGCPLKAGTTGFIISLGSIQTISQFHFVAEKGSGMVTVSLSNTFWPLENHKWNLNRKTQKFSDEGDVCVDIGFSEAKYIRVEFELPEGGRISSFSILGKAELLDYKLKRAAEVSSKEKAAKKMDYLNFDFANSIGGGEVIYVSSNSNEKSPAYINDDLLSTAFEFDAADNNPTMILSLKESKILNRISLSVDGPEAEVQVYLLNNLPVEYMAKKHPRPLNGFIFAALGTQLILPEIKLDGLAPQFKLSEAFFEKNKPVESYEMKGGRETISVNFKPQPVNYILQRCNPKDRIRSKSFMIHKLSAFGSVEVEKEKYVIVYEPIAALADQRLADSAGKKDKDEDPDPRDRNLFPELIKPPIVSK